MAKEFALQVDYELLPNSKNRFSQRKMLKLFKDLKGRGVVKKGDDIDYVITDVNGNISYWTLHTSGVMLKWSGADYIFESFIFTDENNDEGVESKLLIWKDGKDFYTEAEYESY